MTTPRWEQRFLDAWSNMQDYRLKRVEPINKRDPRALPGETWGQYRNRLALAGLSVRKK